MRSIKKLGQNFLINKGKIKKIVDALELQNNDTVIEIGAGRGELTRELARTFDTEHFTDDRNHGGHGLQIIAIEKDKKLADLLKKSFSEHSNIKIITGDALKLLPSTVKSQLSKAPTHYKCVGNIPYYITGKLLRTLGELKHKPKLVVLTLQKEVAERLCAHPPKMNPTHRKCSMCGMSLLAASVQFWAKTEIIDYVPKKDFLPQPKVDSAIVRMRTTQINADKKVDQRRKYYKLIKILFKQPRKTILNNLAEAEKGQKKLCKEQHKLRITKKLQQIGVNPEDRPQTLSVKKIQELSERLKEIKTDSE